MCLLKIHDNVLLYRVSNEFEHDSFTLVKFNQSTKYMLKVSKEMLAKGKSSKIKLNNKAPERRQRYFVNQPCSALYKVKPFLVFVAKIRFFSWEEAYMF